MKHYTYKDAYDCAKREVEMRKMVYPAAVLKGKMTEEAAAKQIAIMEEIRDHFEALNEFTNGEPSIQGLEGAKE